MKIIQKKETIYECEVCDYRSDFKCLVEECEQKHNHEKNCKDDNLIYKIDVDTEDRLIIISVKCTECDFVVNECEFNILQLKQEDIKSIYNIMKKY